MSRFRRRLMMGAVSGGSPLLVSSYTIDQTGTYSAPNQMVRDRDATVFQMIYAASHLYVGYLDNGVLQCKQVSDTDKTHYADGTSVSYDANNDLFMKLPRFWWKCENVDGSADKMKFSFTMDNPKSDTWYEWEGDTFIGAYKGYKDGSNKLRSINGVTATASVQYPDWRTYSRNKGTGYQMVTYEAHQMMALLFWGYFGTLNGQAIGWGANNNWCGTADSKGMNNGAVSNVVNLWGLETWWGGHREILDNVRTTNTTGTVAICDINNNVTRYSTGPVNSGNNCIKKMRFGSYGDVIPYDTSGTSYDYYFCDRGGVKNSANKIGTRCGESNAGYAGQNSLQIWEEGTTGYIGGTTGTRLLYKGPYQIND